MGRGRPPKPTALKLLDGNPGQRPINHNEPKPDADSLYCPTWISKEAKAEWRRLVKSMPPGLLTNVDRAGLAMLCMAWADFKAAEHPTARNLAQQRWVRLAVEFGMTPASRAKLSVPQAEKKDELAILLGEETA